MPVVYCFKSSDAHFLDITWTITWSTDDHLIILGGLLPGFPALHHKVGDIRILGLSLNLSSSMCISASKNAPNLMRYRLTPIAPPWPELPLLNRDPVVVSLAKSCLHLGPLMQNNRKGFGCFLMCRLVSSRAGGAWGANKAWLLRHHSLE